MSYFGKTASKFGTISIKSINKFGRTQAGESSTFPTETRKSTDALLYDGNIP